MKKIFLAVMGLMVATVANAQNPKVKMITEKGEIIAELYADKAPISVANFLRYVDAKGYDNATFFRAVRMDNQIQNKIKIEVVQIGVDDSVEHFDPIPLERTRDTGINHVDGTLSMARGGADTATASFSIAINENPNLDFGSMRASDGQGFAAFGRVISGMEIVREIQLAETVPPADPDNLEFTAGQMIVNPVVIHTIERLE
ncbi:peptidylprolyl isomerase [Pseudemcibacter aquimaris]|uniref:peptidylprolyl isomerase n=1 Tax=Pseudemcibacter aquimaris TaxID=2857064 RepID=UPI002012AD61|nr:peptidylprolyl isomerase [Pseudemcibacter aquimaris]MCC3860964.1 peptidylprolyl isomerase [Pseudemcibacter aquimaris]WDU59782.1 peptidylprolyl isomerase [Pseudemcibacter aquimaris]